MYRDKLNVAELQRKDFRGHPFRQQAADARDEFGAR